MSRLFLLFALFALASGSTLAWTGQVAYVSDGDSIWVKPADGTAAERLRLDGIDAPERCQIGGEASRAALRARILGRGVDVQVRAHDAYGRALASVRLVATGEDVAAWMVRQGWAWSHRFRGHAGPYDAQEDEARAASRGVFAQAQPELPRDFRARHGPCQ